MALADGSLLAEKARRRPRRGRASPRPGGAHRRRHSNLERGRGLGVPNRPTKAPSDLRAVGCGPTKVGKTFAGHRPTSSTKVGRILRSATTHRAPGGGDPSLPSTHRAKGSSPASHPNEAKRSLPEPRLTPTAPNHSLGELRL